MDLVAAEKHLNAFRPDARDSAMETLQQGIAAGEVSTPPLTGDVNVHLHTFHSFNAEDYSPAGLVWEGRKRGMDVVGSVDFDVLDAMEEMFRAGESLGVRTVAALETRVFVEAYADKELNSPGEPGVYYFMGTGFTRGPAPGSPAEEVLDAMRAQARARNEALLGRILPALTPITIDYERDVLPLTPGGNATERHMLAALDAASRKAFANERDLAGFWAERLGTSPEQALRLLPDTAAFRNAIRKALMKAGGIGYVQPTKETFPEIRSVLGMIEACEAIPCAAWLDGTTAGEADAAEWLDFFVGLGCRALNIIPDRNWNISDPAVRATKVAKFNTIVEEASKRHLVLSVGTEMNSYGLKFVDTFSAPEMQPHAALFTEGAYTLYGHTLLQRALGFGLMSRWAADEFGNDHQRANRFYLSVGQHGFPPRAAREALANLGSGTSSEGILSCLKRPGTGHAS